MRSVLEKVCCMLGDTEQTNCLAIIHGTVCCIGMQHGWYEMFSKHETGFEIILGDLAKAISSYIV